MLRYSLYATVILSCFKMNTHAFHLIRLRIDSLDVLWKQLNMLQQWFPGHFYSLQKTAWVQIYSNVSPRVLHIGLASAPTALSVVCDSSSAAVSFQSPVYGGECVDYYVVTAVSEEEDNHVLCNVSINGFSHNCSIPTSGNTSDYNFTVYAVTHVNDSFVYNGSTASNCCESVSITETFQT